MSASRRRRSRPARRGPIRKGVPATSRRRHRPAPSVCRARNGLASGRSRTTAGHRKRKPQHLSAPAPASVRFNAHIDLPRPPQTPAARRPPRRRLSPRLNAESLSIESYRYSRPNVVRILCPNSEFTELVNQSRSTSVDRWPPHDGRARGDPNVRQLEPHWRIAYTVRRAPAGGLNAHISRSTGSS